MSFKTTEAWRNGSLAETLAFKCKDCIPSITHTHTQKQKKKTKKTKTTPSPLQQQQKEHTGAFKNISAFDSLTVCLFRFAYLLIANLLFCLRNTVWILLGLFVREVLLLFVIQIIFLILFSSLQLG